MEQGIDASRYGPRLVAFVLLLFVFVLGAFLAFEAQSLAWTSRLLDASDTMTAIGVLVVAGLALDVFLPVPSTVLAAAAATTLGDTLGFVTVWTGLSAGCVLGYEFGASAGHAVLRRMVKDTHERRLRWLERRIGLGAIVVCRPVPVLAEVSVLLAGSARWPRPAVYALSLAANAAVAGLYVWAVPSLA